MRRHLTPGQRSVIAVKHTEMLTLGDNQYNNEGRTNVQPKSTVEVAAIAGVNEKTVRRAKKALEVAPEKAEDMITGKTTPTKVIQEHKQHTSVEPPAFSEKVYDILYVDPLTLVSASPLKNEKSFLSSF